MRAADDRRDADGATGLLSQQDIHKYIEKKNFSCNWYSTSTLIIAKRRKVCAISAIRPYQFNNGASGTFSAIATQSNATFQHQ